MEKILPKLKNYIPNLILIWLAYAIYKSASYYMSFLRPETYSVLFYLALAYTILGFFYYLFIPISRLHDTKGLLFFRSLKRISKGIISKVKYRYPFPQLTKQEKNALLFTLVKFFFLPLMLNFFFSNFFSFTNQIPNLRLTHLLTIQGFNLVIFPFLLTTIFMIDTLWFAFGYAFEAKFLKNTLRSVEPTFFGWAVALACYPPFNGFVTKYVGWYANDYLILDSINLMFLIRVFAILLLLIYVSATLALGTKCSNLTNRGIVTKGPYAIVRHPAYISKNLAWWITVIPIATWPAILSMAIWSLIYHFRTITEERHLGQDPDYRVYCQKVKYKYIPGIY